MGIEPTTFLLRGAIAKLTLHHYAAVGEENISNVLVTYLRDDNIPAALDVCPRQLPAVIATVAEVVQLWRGARHVAHFHQVGALLQSRLLDAWSLWLCLHSYLRWPHGGRDRVGHRSALGSHIYAWWWGAWRWDNAGLAEATGVLLH